MSQLTAKTALGRVHAHQGIEMFTHNTSETQPTDRRHPISQSTLFAVWTSFSDQLQLACRRPHMLYSWCWRETKWTGMRGREHTFWWTERLLSFGLFKSYNHDFLDNFQCGCWSHLLVQALKHCVFNLSPVSTTRVDGPCWRPVLTDNGNRSPVNSGR